MIDLAQITSLDDPRIDDYRNVPDADLLDERRLFMAEGRLVVRTLLEHSLYRARSVLVTPVALESVRDSLERAPAGLPVYLAAQGLMDQVVGFHIHRGALAAGERPPQRSVAEILADAGRRPGPIVVLEGLSNHDNVGAVFRNARAFGAAAVVLDSRTCDPLYRKAIRVSMGAAIQVPFARALEWPAELSLLEEAGFEILALTPAPDAIDLRALAARRDPARPLALLLGSEGDGLSRRALDAAHARVRISMTPGIDSLNVATASGIALHALADVR